MTTAVTIDDLRRRALQRLPDFLFDPMESGAGTGEGSARNVRRLAEQLLVPRALKDVSRIMPGTDLFGTRYSSSFGVSPIGYAGNFRRNADILLAEAAVAADIPFILSGGANESVETIARIAPRHTWYQLYGAKDPARTDHMLGRARDCGIKVLVFTIDFPVPPRVERLIRSGVRLPASVAPRVIPHVIWQMCKHPAWTLELLRQGGPPPLRGWASYLPPGAGAKAIARDYSTQIPSNQTWKDLDRIRGSWPGTLIIKGIMHPDDATRAAKAGADAVIVSNHGSVKLDCMPATVDVSAASGARGGSPNTGVFRRRHPRRAGHRGGTLPRRRILLLRTSAALRGDLGRSCGRRPGDPYPQGRGRTNIGDDRLPDHRGARGELSGCRYSSVTGVSMTPSPVISMRTTSPANRYFGGF